MKLFFNTLNWGNLLLSIFLLCGFFLAEGAGHAIITYFVFVGLWVGIFAAGPHETKAQALGLNTATKTRYGRIAALLPALIAGSMALYLRWWIALAITVLILAWKLICWKAEAKTMTVESNTWPENGPNIGNMLMTMAILAMTTIFVQHLDSLANFVTLGGSQSTWARHVIIASLVSPAASLLGVGLSWLIVGEPIWLIAAFGFLVPALVVSLELCSWKNVYMPVLIGAATAAIFVLQLEEMLDDFPMVLAAAVTYVLWAVLLPANVRRVNPYATGLKKWLGIKS